MRNTPEIEVHIEYLSHENPANTYIVMPGVPRIGEFVRLPGGDVYEVTLVTWEEPTEGRCRPVISLRHISTKTR